MINTVTTHLDVGVILFCEYCVGSNYIANCPSGIPAHLAIADDLKDAVDKLFWSSVTLNDKAFRYLFWRWMMGNWQHFKCSPRPSFWSNAYVRWEGGSGWQCFQTNRYRAQKSKMGKCLSLFPSLRYLRTWLSGWNGPWTHLLTIVASRYHAAWCWIACPSRTFQPRIIFKIWLWVSECMRT